MLLAIGDCDERGGYVMTGYHIRIGYNGASGWDHHDAWEELKAVARQVADDPRAIVEEARRLGAPEHCSRGPECCTLNTYADSYADPFDSFGHPVTIIEEEDERQIMQLASTGESIKYHVRRAYVRLVIAEMHRREVEINLDVV